MTDFSAKEIDTGIRLEGDADADASVESKSMSVSLPGEDRTRALYDLLSEDLKARHEWSESQRAARRSRLREKLTANRLPYPGAPNLIEPLVDDNTRSLVSAENSILWSSRTLAVMVPVTREAFGSKSIAEAVFDTLLRVTLDVRAKLENICDTKNERGFGVAMLTANATARPGYVLPDFEPVEPLNLIVPAGTRRLRDADRICYIERFSEREFWAAAMDRGWDEPTAHKVWEKYRELMSERGTDESGEERTRWMLNEMTVQQHEIVVWRVFHYRRETEGSLALRKWVVEFCPTSPDLVLREMPWRWEDEYRDAPVVDAGTGGIVIDPAGSPVVQQELVKPGEDRPWPFVQFRFENRSMFFYDCRGIAQLLEDDQKFASNNLNAKGVMMDYTCRPFLKYTGMGTPVELNSWRMKPGSTIPNGLEFAIPPRVDPIFDSNIEQMRQAAARRVGAQLGSYAGPSTSRGQQTATEVATTSRNATSLNGDAVERFAESLGELFTQMWEFLSHHPAPLLAIINGEAQEVDESLFALPFLVVPSISGRNANPELIIRQMLMVSQVFAMAPQMSQFIRGGEFCRWLFDQIDPKITPLVIADTTGMQGGAPIEQMVGQLTQETYGDKKMPGTVQRLEQVERLLGAMVQEQDALDASTSQKGGEE